jgi:hypothetical protein
LVWRMAPLVSKETRNRTALSNLNGLKYILILVKLLVFVS